MTETGDRLALSAIRILGRLGIDCTYDYSTLTPDFAAGTSVSSSSTAVIKCSPPMKYKQFFIDDTAILKDDSYILIAAQTFTPIQGNKVTVVGKTWAVVGVTPLHGDENVAAYKLQIRQ